LPATRRRSRQWSRPARPARADDIEQRDAIEDDLLALRRQAEIFSCLPTV
jgi:hypothetical protein